MNTLAHPGFKVRLKKEGLVFRNEVVERTVREHLNQGVIYTVEYIQLGSTWSWVKLQEIPDRMFSPSHFEDVSTQSVEEDRKHPDWQFHMGHVLKRRHLKGLNTSAITRKLGYSNSRTIYQKLSQWFYQEITDMTEEELELFERYALEFSKGREAEVKVFIELCRSRKI